MESLCLSLFFLFCLVGSKDMHDVLVTLAGLAMFSCQLVVEFLEGRELKRHAEREARIALFLADLSEFGYVVVLAVNFFDVALSVHVDVWVFGPNAALRSLGGF